ncbi:GGDEF domain-containing protein [Williamsia sterculiae]|nr:GGDEF domain-containing protein [Williamsia sterculiae]
MKLWRSGPLVAKPHQRAALAEGGATLEKKWMGMARNIWGRFDARSASVMLCTGGALPLPVLLLFQPSAARPGGLIGMTVVWVFTAVTMTYTYRRGRLSDREFSILGFGGMVGIAVSAFLLADPVVSRGIIAMVAAIPAIAAMASSMRTVVLFTTSAMVLSVVGSLRNVHNWVSATINVGAAVTAVTVPVFMVVALRLSLEIALARQERLGETDPLTGLLNRRGLYSRVERLFDTLSASPQSMGLLLIDIDHFKSVNDQLGHTAGDIVLRDAVQVLIRSAPPGALCCRFGGEEFLIAFTVSDESDLLAWAEHVRKMVAAESLVTISVGGVCARITRMPHGPSNTDTRIDLLMHLADQQVYRAKRDGRDRVRITGAEPLNWVPDRRNSDRGGGISKMERSVGLIDLFAKRIVPPAEVEQHRNAG